MDIAPLIARVARGKYGSQHLGQDEAKAVFSQLLQPDADQLQLGAFLVAQRMKGESSAELAGFVEAVRSSVKGFGEATAPENSVDLPCYAGKRRGGHAYLAAAIKMRDAGVPILVHGIAHIEGRVTAWQVLQSAGVTRANTLSGAADLLRSEGMAYIDLAELSPDLFRIYNLRPRLGVRSFANSVARLLNPLRCAGQLNGFFHTPYGELMAGANMLLDQKRSLIFMGAEGEPELYADRQKLIVMQQGGDSFRVSYDEEGGQAYPREPMTLSLLKRQSLTMLSGAFDRREAAVVRRMCEAFEWAAGESLAAGWSEEV
ncbi:Anthranilate phosphoribosyltransferase [Mariprofundus ferrinatatus]|uniref:Anthranilate phosphoribosyltransferase n=1 Tax=Mariprofundus ferrinatatus TaxID=1921087 RepID=A0A2K8L2H6_9PROT|nr:anthranilate phosphoribosyltransferase [Mariprofundus ferrinatatus]ATX81525.1 Anthranilate phosphoribosyltransferase [Mariprofundus ferrinatatus]